MARRSITLATALVVLVVVVAPASPARLDAPGPAQSFRVTASVDPPEVILGESSTISGTVKPVRTGTAVRIQKKKPSGWVTVAQIVMDGTGAYEHTVSPTKLGQHHYRARMPRVGSIAADNSPRRTVSVIEDPSIVTFTIPPGTGSGSWNTSETAVVGEVGQTLRIVNGDSAVHRLHTDGEPFAHPDSELGPGQTAEFTLLSPFAGGSLYCHAHGSGSRFWITVTGPS